MAEVFRLANHLLYPDNIVYNGVSTNIYIYIYIFIYIFIYIHINVYIYIYNAFLIQTELDIVPPKDDMIRSLTDWDPKS